jgi:hypothetical protein
MKAILIFVRVFARYFKLATVAKDLLSVFVL